MAKKLLSITIRGHHKLWSFEFYGDPQYIEEWRRDGLQVEEVVNTIPDWLPSWFKVRWWVFFQDVFNFKNPWKND